MQAPTAMPPIRNSSTTKPMPAITVDIGHPKNCLTPVESADDFNLRIVQRNQRVRRISNGGI